MVTVRTGGPAPRPVAVLFRTARADSSNFDSCQHRRGSVGPGWRHTDRDGGVGAAQRVQRQQRGDARLAGHRADRPVHWVSWLVQRHHFLDKTGPFLLELIIVWSQ